MKAKDFLVIGLIMIVLGALGFLGKVLFFTPTTIDKSVDMAYEVVDKTLDGDKAIREYEWFKRQVESMKALEKKEVRAIKEVEDFVALMGGKSRDEWSRDDKKEYDRLNANKVAVQNMLDDALAEYNARSKMVNRAIFKDNLPASIDRAILSGLQLMNNKND